MEPDDGEVFQAPHQNSCYALNVSVSSQQSHVEILIPYVRVLGGGVFEGD